MFDEQQKQTKQNMQVKFAQHLDKFRDELTLPEYHFLQDACLGILKSQSPICLKMANSLNEKVTPKKVVERFTRHLNKEKLAAALRSRIIAVQSRNFSHETVIIVDDSDIIKPKAKCMEGLKRVRDGSTGKHDQLGYDLLNVIAVLDGSDGYEIRPLSSDLISRDLEDDSLNQITQDRLVEINLASGNQGVYVFDRGYDSRQLFRFLQTTGMNYVVRSTGDRNLVVGGCERSFLEVAKSVKLDFNIQDKTSNKMFKCGVKRVGIRLDPHPVKNPETLETWLVVARHDSGKKDGYFYLFCDFPDEPDLTLAKIVTKALRTYRMRWKIEEVHRHFKQSYGWEKIQLTSYTRLQNMNQILLLTMCFLYSLKRFAYQYLQAFPGIMSYTTKTWRKIYDFVYYRLTLLVEVCFSTVSRYKINPFSGVWMENQQLILPCLKNGGM